MKRKNKRKLKESWKAIAGIAVIVGILEAVDVFAGINFNNFPQWVVAECVKKNYPLCGNTITVQAICLLASILLILGIIELISASLKQNRKYFELVDFEKPTGEVRREALEGILNSEKAKPSFVHVAPISEEVESSFKKLDKEGFLWISGRPGEGKTMLAYHVLYKFFKQGYKIYELKTDLINKDLVSDEKKLEQIVGELDILKGGKRKIILIDDAHKLEPKFEDGLMSEIRDEAEEKINGKFFGIDTNYLGTKELDQSSSIALNFDEFYKTTFFKKLYQSEDPLIKEVVENRCINLEGAIKQKEVDHEIKDPWHFNFIATKGEERITEALNDLGGGNEAKRRILRIAIFLFSVRNIITGEKEITEIDFIDKVLPTINNEYVYNPYQSDPLKIIIDLVQENRRLLIINDESSFQRNLLKAPHYRSSIAIVKRLTELCDENEVERMIDASKIFLKNDYKDSAYLGVYFSSIGKYQTYFLNENKNWVKGFLTNVIVEQLQVYPFFLNILREYHEEFFRKLITDEYFDTIAPEISSSSANKFSAIAAFLTALKDKRGELIGRLNFEKLAEVANKAGADQLSQVAEFLGALKDKRGELIGRLSFEKLAGAANKATVYQLKQVAAFLTALKDKRGELIGRLNFEKLAEVANKAGADQLSQVAEFLGALKDKRGELIGRLSFEKLAGAANKAGVDQLEQVANFLQTLGNERNKLVEKFDFEKLAGAANKATVYQLKQVAAFLTALEDKKGELIGRLDFEKLAEAANKAGVEQFAQLEAILNVLGNERNKLIEKFDFEKLAGAANKATVYQLKQVADLLGALKDKRKKLSQYFVTEVILRYSKLLGRDQIPSFCIIVANLDKQKKNQVIQNIDWASLLDLTPINHPDIIKHLSYILDYHNTKCNLLNQDANDKRIRDYLSINRNKIIYFSTCLFSPPDGYQSAAYVLDALYPHAIDISKTIVGNLEYKIISQFKISPLYYHSFSHLLDAIHRIHPPASNAILSDRLVWEKLYSSLQEDDFKDHQYGLQNLINSIKTINPIGYNEIIANKIINQKLLICHILTH